MKQQSKIALALFLAGFFAKDIIDSAGFLLTNNYPLDIFGITITAIHHKVTLVVSTILMALLLIYGLRKRKEKSI